MPGRRTFMLPDRTTTTRPTVYAKVWRQLAADVIEFMGWTDARLNGFDPTISFVFEKSRYHGVHLEIEIALRMQWHINKMREG